MIPKVISSSNSAAVLPKTCPMLYQFCSIAWSCLTLCDPIDCSMPGFPVHHQLPGSLLKLMSIMSVMPSNHLILCCPLLLPPSIIPSIRVFSNESALPIRWPKYWNFSFSISSVQFSHSVVCDSLRPHKPQHTRPPCPSPVPGVHPNPCPSNRWCHPAILSCFVPFSSWPQSFPASLSFQMSQLFASTGQSIEVSASAISTSNEHPGLISFRMDWLDLLAVQGTLKSLPQHHSSKASIWCSAVFIVQLSHPYMTPGKTIALTRWPFVGKVMSLLFNMLSRFVITFFQGASVF